MTHSIRLRDPRLLAFLGLMTVGLLVLLVLGLKATHKTPPDLNVVAADANVQQGVSANTDFGFRLLKQLTQQTPDKNIFFSPFSVSDALTMTLNGAGGATKADMASTLGLNTMTLDQINQANGLLLPSLENPDPQVELSVANALWANTGTAFDSDFQTRCSQFYEARTDTLDFGSPAAADTINGWVKDNTHGKIDQIVTASDLAGAIAVLTNAVYFHGPWRQPFEKSNTQDGPFQLAGGGSVTVPLMSQEGGYSFLETPQFQAISLPYGTGRLSLYIFLPKSKSDPHLTAFVNGLNRHSWEGWIKKMQPTGMTIILPRFQAHYEATLNTPLIALGMGSAFGLGADFAPMGVRGAAISKVVHKAVIEVDETGTVAAAATGVEMDVSSYIPQIMMRVDHPFFCAIRDNTTRALLFAGVIRDPKN